MSLPSRERGLKWHPVYHRKTGRNRRSPRGSADWNRTRQKSFRQKHWSLPSRERGLKCTDDGDNLFFQHGRSPCGSDHWNRKDNRISCTMWLHRRRISNWVRRLGKGIGQRKRIWKPYFGETEWHRKNTRWKTDIWVKIFISKKMETICHFGCKKRTWKHN